jgi:hypothetical protein
MTYHRYDSAAHLESLSIEQRVPSDFPTITFVYIAYGSLPIWRCLTDWHCDGLTLVWEDQAEMPV